MAFRRISAVCLLEIREKVTTKTVMQEMQETGVLTLGWEDALEEEREIHSSILAWENPTDGVKEETDRTGSVLKVGLHLEPDCGL